MYRQEKELAQAFINGALAYVKNKIKNDPSLAMGVLKELKEYSQEEADSLMSWICMW